MWLHVWKNILIIYLLAFSLLSEANSLQQQRQNFILAEQMIKQRNDKGYAAIKTSLEKYPLYFYLQYQWLSKHLQQGVKVKAFIRANNGNRYTRQLRSDWLRYLYKHKKWREFTENYKYSKSRLWQCRYQWARYKQNYKTLALKATQKIWLTGHSLPKDCDVLLKKFVQSKFFTQKIIWQRFKLAVNASQPALARYLFKKLTDKALHKQASFWLKLMKKPKLIAHTQFLQGLPQTSRSELFVYAIKRLINQDVERALALWKRQQSTLQLSKKQRHKVNRALALQLAFSKSTKAYVLFKQLSHLDKVTREWAVRAALIEGNWSHVQQALNKLSVTEKKTQRWQYWQAKAFAKTQHPERSAAIFKVLAKERGYYGFMAADTLQKDYLWSDKPIVVEQQKRLDLLASKDFSIVEEFKAQDKHDEAKKFWWSVVRRFNKKDLLVAAKIAQQWRWHKQAILAVAQAQEWDDLVLRFPIEYKSKIDENAKLQDLEPMIIYGLVRRESLFDKQANSPAGALGLMQVMPKTGRQVAKALQVTWHSKKDLLKAPINLRFGIFYYKQMLGKFGGNFALAAAAYNAGPHRVIRWLNHDNNYAADVWIETIPFKETRGYVAAVLTYALVYQYRTGGKGLKMRDMMGIIKARKS